MTFKKLIAAFVAASAIAFAGGDIEPVESTEPEVVVEPGLTGLYVGAGYSYIAGNLDIIGLSLSEGANAGVVLAGYNINDYLAVEGRYTFSADIDYDTLGASVEGDTWGIYVKPQYNLSTDFKVYGLLGYGEVRDLDDGAGFQYGFGGAYSVTKNIEVFGDWVRAYDADVSVINPNDGKFTVDLFAVGVNYKF